MQRNRFLHATFLATGAALILGACTERQACEARVHNHMADIKAQIAEVEDNLDRGHTYVRDTNLVQFGPRFCTVGDGVFFLCTGDENNAYRRVRIDAEAERAKLATLKARLPQLQAELAQCAVTYPEG